MCKRVIVLADTGNLYRLVGGTSTGEGVLQYRSAANETWNTLCSSDEQIISPGIGADICRQVGYKVFCWADDVASVQGFGSPNNLGDYPLKRVFVLCRLDKNGVNCSLSSGAGNDQPCTPGEALWMNCDHSKHERFVLLQAN